MFNYAFAGSFSMYFRLLSIQIRSQMQYRISFLLDIFSTAALNGAYVVIILLVVDQFKTVQGWSLGEIAWLIAIAEISFGLMDMIFGGFDQDIFGEMIRTGRFDQYLLRPVDVTLQVLGSRFTLRRLGRVTEGTIIFVIALSQCNIHWTLAKILYLPVVVVSLVLAFASLFVAGAALIFWTQTPTEALNIVTYGGVELISYPMSIYPGWMVRFFTYLIPFIFMNYYPALFFLEKPDPLNFPPFAPFLAPFVGLAMFSAALAFWRFGVDHYQSTGS